MELTQKERHPLSRFRNLPLFHIAFMISSMKLVFLMLAY